MTQVSSPSTGGLPRGRGRRLGSLGAVALVVAMGAAIAGGIAVTTDDAPAVAPAVTESESAFSYPITVDDLVNHGIISAPHARAQSDAAGLQYPVTVEDLVKNGIIQAPFGPAAAEPQSGPR